MALSTAEKNRLRKRDFAFPEQRKEPLVDAKHVRNAIARFDQVEDVSDKDRDRAWKRIRKAAERFDVDVSEKSWHELGDNGGKPTKQQQRTKTKKTTKKKTSKTGPKARTKRSKK